MSKAEEKTGPLWGHIGEPEGGGFQLLDRTFTVDRCPLKPGDMVQSLISHDNQKGGKVLMWGPLHQGWRDLGASCWARIRSSRESEAGSGAVGSISVGQGDSCQYTNGKGTSEARGREETRPVEEFGLGGGK